MGKVITVFGSSFPNPGDEEYELAYELGKILSKNGYNICNGGYSGTMEAVSKGAAVNSAEVIGVTVINKWNSAPNKFLTNKIQTQTLFERITKLVELGDAYIILNGGTGTLLELSVVWEFINKGFMPLKPIIVLGEMWTELCAVVNKRNEFEKRDSNIIKRFNNIDEVIKFLKSNLE